MKVSQAIEQLYKTLPFLTEKFSDGVNILNVDFNDLVATVTTDSAHGLEQNDTCTILGLYSPLSIFSITRTGDKLLILTNENHDFTKDFQKIAKLDGSIEPDFNGSFQILDIVDSKSFILQTIDSGPTIATGFPFVKEETGQSYNQITGYKTVASAPTLNTLTFTLETPLNASIDDLGSIATGYRITGAVDFESALEMYTDQEDSEYWAFVVSGASNASRDRKNNSDAIYTINSNTGYRQELNQIFSVYVFATVTNLQEAYPIKDDMQDMGAHLIKSLCGSKFDNGFYAGDHYSNVFDSHITQFYNGAIYAHSFIFQTTTQVTQSDVFEPSNDVAIRQINLSMNSIVEEFKIKPNSQKLESTIDL